MRVILCTVAALALGCGGEGGEAAQAPKAGVSAEKEGAEWTHRELVDHLKAKGVEVVLFLPGQGDEPTVGLANRIDKNTGLPDNEAAAVACTLKQTAAAARDAAGADPAAHSWGRFLFQPDTKNDPDPLSNTLMAAIKKALP